MAFGPPHGQQAPYGGHRQAPAGFPPTTHEQSQKAFAGPYVHPGSRYLPNPAPTNPKEQQLISSAHAEVRRLLGSEQPSPVTFMSGDSGAVSISANPPKTALISSSGPATISGAPIANISSSGPVASVSSKGPAQVAAAAPGGAPGSATSQYAAQGRVPAARITPEAAPAGTASISAQPPTAAAPAGVAAAGAAESDSDSDPPPGATARGAGAYETDRPSSGQTEIIAGRATPQSVLRVATMFLTGTLAPPATESLRSAQTKVIEIAKRLHRTSKPARRGAGGLSFAPQGPVETLFSNIQLLVNQVTDAQLVSTVDSMKKVIADLHKQVEEDAKSTGGSSDDVDAKFGEVIDRVLKTIHTMSLTAQGYIATCADLITKLGTSEWPPEQKIDENIVRKKILKMMANVFMERTRELVLPLGEGGEKVVEGTSDYLEGLSRATAARLKEQHCNLHLLASLYQRGFVPINVPHKILRETLILDQNCAAPITDVESAPMPTPLDIQLASMFLADVYVALAMNDPVNACDGYLNRLQYIYKALGKGDVKEHSKVCFLILDNIELINKRRKTMNVGGARGGRAPAPAPAAPKAPAGPARVPPRAPLGSDKVDDSTTSIKAFVGNRGATPAEDIASFIAPPAKTTRGDAMDDLVYNISQVRGKGRNAVESAVTGWMKSFVVNGALAAPGPAFAVALACLLYVAETPVKCNSPSGGNVAFPAKSAMAVDGFGRAFASALSQAVLEEPSPVTFGTTAGLLVGQVRSLIAPVGMSGRTAEQDAWLAPLRDAAGSSKGLPLRLLDYASYSMAGGSLEVEDLEDEAASPPQLAAKNVVRFGNAAFAALADASISREVAALIHGETVEHSLHIAVACSQAEVTAASIAAYPAVLKSVALARPHATAATAAELRTNLAAVPAASRAKVAAAALTLAVLVARPNAAAAISAIAPVVTEALAADAGAVSFVGAELFIADAIWALPSASREGLPAGWMSKAVSEIRNAALQEFMTTNIKNDLGQRLDFIMMPPAFVPEAANLTTSL